MAFAEKSPMSSEKGVRKDQAQNGWTSLYTSMGVEVGTTELMYACPSCDVGYLTGWDLATPYYRSPWCSCHADLLSILSSLHRPTSESMGYGENRVPHSGLAAVLHVSYRSTMHEWSEVEVDGDTVWGNAPSFDA